MAWSTEGTLINAVVFKVRDDNASNHTVSVKNPKTNLSFDESETMVSLLEPYGNAAELRDFYQDTTQRKIFTFA